MHRDTIPTEKQVTPYAFYNIVEKAHTVAMGLVRILNMKFEMYINTDIKNFES